MKPLRSEAPALAALTLAAAGATLAPMPVFAATEVSEPTVSEVEVIGRAIDL